MVDGFHRVGDQDPAQLDRLSKAEGATSYLGMLPAEECGMIERGQHLVAVNGQSVLDIDFKEALQLVKQQFQIGADTERCSIRLTFRTRLPDGFQRLRFVNNGIVATGPSADSMPFRCSKIL